jgi:hypothetical protein
MVNALMGTIIVLSIIHMKVKHIQWQKNGMILNVKAGGTYSNHCAIKG